VARSHVGARQSMQRSQEVFGDNPRFLLDTVYNGGTGQPHSVDLNSLPAATSYEDLVHAFRGQLDEALAKRPHQPAHIRLHARIDRG
jgi:hypothetical protein